MTSSLNYMDLCRLCLVKEHVAFPIFDGEDDVRQIFIKISTCLPVKVSKEDRLPKKICSNCVYRVENSFEFWNTTASAEKQLLEWLEENCNERKVGPSAILSSTNQETVMEAEQLVLKEETLEQDQSASSKNASRVGAIQTEEGAKTVEGGGSDEEEEEVESEDGEEAMGNDSEESGEEDVEEPANKEEVESEDEEEDEPYEELEPTTFVNVSLACDEAGPSGAQQTEGSEQKQQQQSRTIADSAAATSVCGSEEPSTSTAAPSTSGLVLFRIPENIQISAKPSQVSNNLATTNQTVPSIVFNDIQFLRVFNSNGGVVNMTNKANTHHVSKFVNAKIKLRPETPLIGNISFPLKSNTSANTACSKPQLNAELTQPDVSQCTSNCTNTRTQVEEKLCNTSVLDKHGLLVTTKVKTSYKRNYLHMSGEHSFIEPIVEKVSSVDYTTEPASKPAASQGKKQLRISQDDNSRETERLKRKLRRVHKLYTCNLCKTIYKTKTSIEKHMKTCRGVQKSHTCNICDKTFRHKHHLNVHGRSHVSKQEFTCEVCGYKCKCNTTLRIHKLRHFQQYRFKCEICDKGYYNKCELKNHHQQHHSKPNTFDCNICSRSWKAPGTLAVHMRIHHPELYEGQPLFECDICGEKFVLKQVLTRHKTRRHPKDKCPNLCEVCGKSLTSASSLRAHLRSHKGEKSVVCEVCGKSFSSMTYLSIHVRTHTGEKPYTCDHCGKSFTQFSSIGIHMRYHTGERPYACSICERRFVSRSFLNQHLKSFHAVKQWSKQEPNPN